MKDGRAIRKSTFSCLARNNDNRSRTNRIDVSRRTMDAVNRYLQGVASHELVVAQEEMDSERRTYTMYNVEKGGKEEAVARG